MGEELIEDIAIYSVGIISLLLFTLIVLAQSALVGAAKGKAGAMPGSDPEADYESALYRMNRSHQNGAENLAAAAIVLFAGILAGVAAAWVNWLMVILLIARVA